MKSYVKDAKELLWSFDKSGPFLKLPVGSWGERVEVDPFPCYPHKKEIVKEQLQKVVESSWDLGVGVFIGHHEDIHRTNAWASETLEYGDYIEEEKRYETTPRPHIFLLGKRIPPHPSVTRYLVAHEYGHCVEYWLNRQLGLDDDGRKPNELREAYRKMRGLRLPKNYGGGTWHKSPGEVLACDFRVLICNVETEYWPHDGVEYPDPDSSIGRWWSHLLEEPEEKWRPPCKGF